MEYIYVDKIIDNLTIAKTLSQIFPELIVFHFDFNDDKPESLDYNNSDHIFFNTSFNPNKIEFGLTISIFRTNDSHSSERQLYIGRLFSDRNNVRVLVPYNKPDNPHDPYYDIIFDNGKIYLADDNDTNFADDTGGLVKILKEYLLPDIQFDNKGQLINEQ